MLIYFESPKNSMYGSINSVKTVYHDNGVRVHLKLITMIR